GSAITRTHPPSTALELIPQYSAARNRIRLSGGLFLSILRAMKSLEGPIRISAKGVGYVSLDPAAGRDGEAVEIEQTSLNTALHGDLVKVALQPRIANQPQTGVVVEILERK